MLKTSRLAALAILGILAASPVYAADKPADVQPAATAPQVNGITIPQERIDLRVKMVTTQQGQTDSPELRKAIREDLINIELMSQEALKKGLDKQSDTVQQLELAKETVLVGAFVQDYMKTHPVSDDAIAKEYDNLKASLGTKEYSVRHILVDKESDAKSIVAKLKKGGKEGSFDKLAKAHSKDPGSKEHGGDLGWIPVSKIPSAFVKPFGDALMGLSKGQVSEPVQSQFGWHIIKLEDVRDLKMPPLDEIKPQLTQRLQQQAVKQLITDLRTAAKIE
jgi:peptidyl-prolyl cis-trans isomerase C